MGIVPDFTEARLSYDLPVFLFPRSPAIHDAHQAGDDRRFPEDPPLGNPVFNYTGTESS